jgi:hypothetical protein
MSRLQQQQVSHRRAKVVDEQRSRHAKTVYAYVSAWTHGIVFVVYATLG